MLRRLLLTNFQSHEHSELVLHPCVTTIIGENDSGKTAFVRALLALVNDEEMDPSVWAMSEKLLCAIRGDWNDFSLERQRVEDSDGKLVPKSNLLRLTRDGETQDIASLRGGYPDYLRELIGMDLVVFEGSNPFSLNVHAQEDGPFLIGNEFSASTRLKILGTVTDHHLFDVKLREVNVEKKRLEDEAKVIAKLRAEAEDNLKEIASEPRWMDIAEDLKKSCLDEHDQLLVDVERIEEVIEECRQFNLKRADQARMEEILETRTMDELATSIAEIDELTASTIELQELVDEHERLAATARSSERTVEVLRAVDDLEDQIQSLEEATDPRELALISEHESIQFRAKYLNEELSRLNLVDKISTLVDEIETLGVEKVRTERELLVGLEIASLVETSEIKEKNHKIADAKVDVQYDTLEAEYRKLLAETDRCPFWDEAELQPACRKQMELIEV